MENTSYLSQLAKRIFLGAFSKGSAWGGTASGLLPVAGHFVPSLNPVMGNLGWQIPVFALAGASLVRLVLAPYEMWKEQRQRAEKAEAKENGADFTLEFGDVICGGSFGTTEQKVFCTLLSVTNIGNKASAVKFKSWRLYLISPDEDYQCLLEPHETEIRLAGPYGRPVPLKPNNAMFQALSTPLQVGEIKHGHLLAVIPRAKLDSIDQRTVVRIAFVDAFDKKYQFDWRWVPISHNVRPNFPREK